MSVDVTITNGQASYKSSNAGVSTDGTININEGEDATITFETASGQTWFFQSPWVVITPTGGDVTLASRSASAVVLQDNNPQGPASTYTYCLQTTIGALDPRL